MRRDLLTREGYAAERLYVGILMRRVVIQAPHRSLRMSRRSPVCPYRGPGACAYLASWNSRGLNLVLDGHTPDQAHFIQLSLGEVA